MNQRYSNNNERSSEVGIVHSNNCRITRPRYSYAYYYKLSRRVTPSMKILRGEMCSPLVSNFPIS